MLALTQVFSEARLLEAAEGRRHVRLVVRVDEHGSRVQEVGDVHRFVDVTCEDAGSETVLGAVGAAQDSLHVTTIMSAHMPLSLRTSRAAASSPLAELADHHDGSERLLVRDEHVVRDVSEDGRIHEETCARPRRTVDDVT